MTDIISNVVAILALIVSVFAFLGTKSTNKIAIGALELQMRQTITDTQNQVEDFIMIMNPLTVKKEAGNIDNDELSLLGKYENHLSAKIEKNLNAYNSACAAYLDNKIDKKRFKKDYSKEIRQLVENEHLRDKFDTTTSPYKSILEVYKELG
jgi:t-SNARE complex subunit (syntaxin)